MYIKVAFLIVFSTTSIQSNCQNTKNIFVVDSNMKPLSHSFLELNNTIYEWSSGKISTPCVNYAMHIYCPGYKTVLFESKNCLSDTVIMQNIQINLNEVVISGGTKNQKRFIHHFSTKQIGFMKHYYSQDSTISFIYKVDDPTVLKLISRVAQLHIDVKYISQSTVYIKYRCYNDFNERHNFPFYYEQATVSGNTLKLQMYQYIKGWDKMYIEFKVLQKASDLNWKTDGNNLFFRMYPQRSATTWIQEDLTNKVNTYRKTDPSIYLNLGVSIEYFK